MSKKRQLDLDVFFAEHPVFMLEELASARGSPSDTSGAANQLKHHQRRGRVKSVARGLYAVVPPGLDPEGFQPDRYLVGAAAKPAGVFSYHAALELLGVAHSVWGECTLHCKSPRSPIELDSVTVLFLPTPEPLLRDGHHELAIRTVAHETRHLRVTGPERTLVEGFRQPHRVGGLRELLECTLGFSLLDFDLLEQVLEAYDQRSLWAAVGWLVATMQEQWHPPQSFLDTCRRHRPRRNQYLLRDHRGGTTLPEWHLIVPPDLLGGFEGHVADA